MISHRHSAFIFLLAFITITPPSVQSQDLLHPQAPEFSFVEQTQGRDRTLNERLVAKFLDDHRFVYRKDLADGAREYILVDAKNAEKRPAFDHAKLATALAKQSGKDVVTGKLDLEVIAIEEDDSIIFVMDGKQRKYTPKTDEVTESKIAVSNPTHTSETQARNDQRSSQRGANSPSGEWSALLRESTGHNIKLLKTKTGREFPMTSDATDSDVYEPGVFWSPDSKFFVAMKTAKEQEHLVQFVQSSPKTQVQPKLLQHQYLKPGDKIAITKPHLFNAETKEEIPIKDDLFPNPWSLDQVRWSADSSRFTFLYNQRGHQVMRLVAVDVKTGEAKALIDEQSKTFIDYSNKIYCRFLEKSDDILWMSERDGWNHLYLIDAKTGEVKNQVTKGEWVVRGVDRIDEDSRTVEFRAMGIHPNQDPYYLHHAKVKFDGLGLTTLTDGDGTHTVQYSPGRKYLIDTYSRVDLPPIHELRRLEDGKLVVSLDKADVSEQASAGMKYPERFTAKGRDGKTDIYGLIVRPKDFDANKKYPVIEQIYAGPHGAHVPKAFGAGRGVQGLADLGFLLVQIDGMGTNWRSKAFHDVAWKNIKDAGFPDRILWMKAAAEKHPEMDLSRVGIYGGSAGGQNAMAALLFHNEFYKVAVADCGCHDNRMDKIWWNEAWMGWPIDKSYEDSSNVVNAEKLQGKLLLMVGETDHNVDPASTMQVINALIKADKDFELIVFPGTDHGAGGSPYGRKRMREFFKKHLQ